MANWSASYGPYVTLKVTATEVEVNTANNTSKVRVQSSIYYGGGTSTVNNYPQTLTVSVNGSNIGTQTGITYSLSSGGTKTLNTYTSGAITHNSDGSKSVNVTVNITDNAGDTGRISQTLTLTTIARASTPTLSSGTVAIGSAVTINTNRASPSFTHTATFKFGSLTKTITTKNANSSFTYTPTTDLATQIPNDSSGWGTITLTTYSGSTAIGSKTVKLTVTVPNNSTFNPTITVPSVSEGVAEVTSAVGAVYVQGKSRLVLKATPTTRGGASVKTVIFTVKASQHTGSGSGSGQVYTSTTGTLSDSGSHAISVTVTDTRGRTATASVGTAPNVLAYNPPKINSFTAVRDGTTTTNVNINRNISYSIVGSNIVTLYIGRVKVGETANDDVEWVQYTTGTGNIGSITSEGNEDANSYHFTLSVTDKFSSASSMVAVSTSGATMSWGKDGIASGKIYDSIIGGPFQVGPGTSVFDGGIHVKGPLYMDGGIQPKYVPDGSDLNDYHTPGFYYNTKNTEVETMSNTPVKYSFSLIVETHAGTKQTFTRYNAGTPGTYTRNFYNGSWGDWHETSSFIRINNANGQTMRFADGLQIVLGTASFPHTAQDCYQVMPADFHGTDFAVTFNASKGNWDTIEDVQKIGCGPSNAGGIRFRKAGNLSFVSTSAIPLSYMAIGRWKP